MLAGVLPELAALGELLEANEEWQQDASGVRSRMLGILGAVADRYEAKGDFPSFTSASSWSLLQNDVVASGICLH